MLIKLRVNKLNFLIYLFASFNIYREISHRKYGNNEKIIISGKMLISLKIIIKGVDYNGG